MSIFLFCLMLPRPPRPPRPSTLFPCTTLFRSQSRRAPLVPAEIPSNSFRIAPDMNAVEEDDLDLDAGRHLDDGLVLFGAFDEVLAHRVGSFARALAKAARDNVGGGERLALAVSADLACEDAIGVGGNAPTKAADDPGKPGLAHEAALAADDAAAHARLAGKADEALDLAHRIAAARLSDGHAGKPNG